MTVFSRNGHRIKITQPNLMILVSFSSGEDALSNDVKIYHTFSSQGTENPAFHFFGGHPVCKLLVAAEMCTALLLSMKLLPVGATFLKKKKITM